MSSSDDGSTYTDDGLPVEARVTDLLQRMTLEEKVGQLVGTYVGQLHEPKTHEDVREEVLECHVGSVAAFGWAGAAYNSVAEIAEAVNDLQRSALEDTRLGIPLLIPVDAVHGHAYVNEATVFPNNLGAGASWNEDLVERTARVTAREVRASGAHQNYSPTCDVARDQRWGRTGETFGESATLVARMAGAKTRGYQGEGIEHAESVAATAKHFPAYGQPERGEDAAPVDVSEYALRRIFLDPFHDVIDAGVEAVMPCYNSIDGEPAHGSTRYLTNLLRAELGFEGVVSSDWGGVDMLHENHRVARDAADSTLQTRLAGLDVASVAGVEHAEHLVVHVERGAIDEAVVDRSVERVLSLKFRMGLFEDPFVDVAAAASTLGAYEHRSLACELARESLTLLKNEDLLPLSPAVDEVFVTGPNADDLVNQLGGWSSFVDEDLPGQTVLEGIEAVVGEATTVTYEPGSGIGEPGDVAAAVERAATADVAIAVLGEGWYLHEFGPQFQASSPTGEFPTRDQLHLPPAQHELLEAIVETGTPVVGVLVTGRPLIVDWMAEHVPAILLAYYPGTEGGVAIAETLFGQNDPRGRLPISIPRSMGQLPTVHDYLPHPHPIGDEEHPPSYDPLYAFGHGLSYTEFEYTDVSVSSESVTADEDVHVDVTLRNVGGRPGREVVQAFVTDVCSSRVTPARTLAGYDRVDLEPDEETTVSISLEEHSLGVVQPNGTRVVEPGEFEVHVDEHTVEFRVEE